MLLNIFHDIWDYLKNNKNICQAMTDKLTDDQTNDINKI